MMFDLAPLMEVSTHAPLAGSDGNTVSLRRCYEMFQPTLPLRGATSFLFLSRCEVDVSTHAPLAGSDDGTRAALGECLGFNPRSPCGERHAKAHREGRAQLVSTHAPLAGSDGVRPLAAPLGGLVSTHAPLAGSDVRYAQLATGSASFNPRSPCGERRNTVSLRRCYEMFQPTLPLRGATSRCRAISSTRSFNPRSPCGERRPRGPIMGGR